MGAQQALKKEPVFTGKSNVKSINQTNRFLKSSKSRKLDKEYDFHFRTERIFSVGHEWYFSTREDIDFGPYQKKERAQQALEMFLRVVA